MFVTFEGIDWSGKSTQAKLLAAWLGQQGRAVLTTREPGGTPVAEAVRELVLHRDEMSPWAEAALYAAARAENVEAVIRPALARGDDVVCDRYLDSSVAYQGAGRGLGEDRVRELPRHGRAAARPHVSRRARPRGCAEAGRHPSRPHRAGGRRFHAGRRPRLPVVGGRRSGQNRRRRGRPAGAGDRRGGP